MNTKDIDTFESVENTMDGIQGMIKTIEEELLELDKSNPAVTDMIESIDRNFNTILIHLQYTKKQIAQMKSITQIQD
jgi:archaellum component FlaC